MLVRGKKVRSSIWDADSPSLQALPQGIYVRPDFEFYGEVSDRVMSLLRKFADRFEQTSIDEVYLDVGDRCASYDEAIDLARRLKSELKNAEGLTVSVGIAPNKSIAKMASDMNKPDGLTTVRPEDVKVFLEPLSVNKISGVGKKTTIFLEEHGVETIGQLRQIP